MAECKDCIHYCVCDKFTAPNETYPEVGGCKCFKPSADVVEVRHGEWKDNHNGTFVCSVCGGKSPKKKWCGDCGAKMDEKG